MSQPWMPEIVVAPELALELVREQFPGLAPGRAELLGHGWDNTAYLLDGRLVFRFPRRASAVALLEAEATVLPAVAGRVPLPVPLPEWVGQPSKRFGWPFVGYRKLQGTPESLAPLEGDELEPAAAALGAFLRALHAVPTAGLPLPEDIGRLKLAERLPVVRERLAALAERGRVQREPWLELFAGEIPARGPQRVLVHGDLYPQHLLVEGGRLVAVIDWGDVHANDPAVDLSAAFSLFPAAARVACFAAYGDVSASTLRLARLRAAFHSISTLWYADSVDNAALLRSGLRSLRNILDA